MTADNVFKGAIKCNRILSSKLKTKIMDESQMIDKLYENNTYIINRC